jgi:hypothetical protein
VEEARRYDVDGGIRELIATKNRVRQGACAIFRVTR